MVGVFLEKALTLINGLNQIKAEVLDRSKNLEEMLKATGYSRTGLARAYAQDQEVGQQAFLPIILGYEIDEEKLEEMVRWAFNNPKPKSMVAQLRAAS